MATAKRKPIIGHTACPRCGREVAIRAENGDSKNTLCFPCNQGCDFPGYAPAGSEAHKLTTIHPSTHFKEQEKKPAQAAPAAKKDPAPAAPAPVVKKPEEKNIFGI